MLKGDAVPEPGSPTLVLDPTDGEASERIRRHGLWGRHHWPPKQLDRSPRARALLHADAPSLARSRRIPLVVSVFAVALGIVALIGWALDIERLKSAFTSAAIKPNTAVCLVLLGLSLQLLRTFPVSVIRRSIARIAAGACASVGILTLGAYVFGWDAGIDNLLFATDPGGGRMSAVTALAVLLLSLGLLLIDASRVGRSFSEWCSMAALGISTLGLVGYVYGASLLSELGAGVSITLPTAIALMLLGVGVLAARPEQGIAARLTGRGVIGSALRRLVPAVVIVPVLLGWLSLQGQQAGMYGPETGSATLVILNVAAFGVLILMTSRKLGVDAERSRAETEVQQLDRELARVDRTEELEAAVKELDAFSYSVSHDLRAPLRAMDGFSRILLEQHSSELPAEGRRYLGMVRESAQDMAALIDDMLAFSRLGRQPLKRGQIDPATVVRQVMVDLSGEHEDRKVSFSVSDLPSCSADPALLKQIFMNLIENALKYTRKRDLALIDVGCRRGSPVVYYVRDNGVGFDMAYADGLFSVFERLHRMEEYEGTGVGLAIVQRIVHRHGGRIWAEAAPDKGATFFFTMDEGSSHV